VAGRLEPRDAARARADATATLVAAMARTTDPGSLVELESGLSAVAGRLEPRDAARAAAAYVAAMGKTTDQSYPPNSPADLARAMSAALNGCESSERTRRAAAVASTVGLFAGSGWPVPSLALLTPSAEPLPCRLTTQEMVDFLKQPTCVDPARRAVLDYLGYQCRRPFRDPWEFVDYARVHLPDIDLAAPPKRPDR
jgi:hypothetical protein